MNDHSRGLFVTILGVLFIMPDSLFVRLIDGDPFVISFWRGMIAGLVVLIGILVFHRAPRFSSLQHTGWAGVAYILLLASTTPAFVLAVSNTSVANVVFIFASTPVFAAVFSLIILGEPISKRLSIAMTFVLIGLGIIAYGSKSMEIANWKGDLWATYVAAAYALALTLVRKVKETTMIPAIPIAYIGGALVIGSFHSPIDGFSEQWPLFLTHGVLIGLASCFLTLGPKYISSAEVSLIIMLESVLAPVLVWAIIGENPGSLAILGGTIVVVSLIIYNILRLRSSRYDAQ